MELHGHKLLDIGYVNDTEGRMTQRCVSPHYTLERRELLPKHPEEAKLGANWVTPGSQKHAVVQRKVRVRKEETKGVVKGQGGDSRDTARLYLVCYVRYMNHVDCGTWVIIRRP